MNLGPWSNVARSVPLKIEPTPSTVERTRHIALLILEDCPLTEAAGVAETYQLVNESLSHAYRDVDCYSVCMLSSHKGFVPCASSMRLFVENIDDFDPCMFSAVFVGGGHGVNDPGVHAWLMRARPEAELVAISPDAQHMLQALGRPTHSKPDASKRELATTQATLAGNAPESGQIECEPAFDRILTMVEHDFGVLARVRIEMLRANRPAARRGAVAAKRPDVVVLSDRIEASILWIKSNHAGSVSISELARRASMSERNFLRRFKAEVGQTPREHLAKVRMENAQLLLIQTDLPVDKIARRCGLFNGDHLRRYFMKHFSVSPVEYRLSARGRLINSKATDEVKSEIREDTNCR